MNHLVRSSSRLACHYVQTRPLAAIFSLRTRPSILTLSRQHSSASRIPPAPVIILSYTPVDEEQGPSYNPKNAYPANPGDLINDEFQLIVKIGWGSASTVWLARVTDSDTRKALGEYVALKICNCDILKEYAMHELNINSHLARVDSNHRGRAIVATARGGFEIDSPRQSKLHLVLVFDLLREPFWILQKRIDNEGRVTKDSLAYFKAHIQILLRGLDFMHSEGHVVHTDLKLSNIMLTFEDPSTIDTFVEAQVNFPMARKHLNDHTVYLCHNNFGEIRGDLKEMIPQIIDFGQAQRGDKNVPQVDPIQPDFYQAPEVLLGTGWSYSADIWNFGVMMWDLLDDRALFRESMTQSYSPAQHLADMIALLGPIPQSIIEQEKKMRPLEFSLPAVNADGKLCNNVAEYFGGPFIDNDGVFAHKDLIPRSRKLENELPGCVREGKEAELFLAFIRRMLCWIPEERATAAELVNDPWLS